MAEQNNKQTTPKLAQIELGEAVKFNNIISTATVTSAELEETIAELFASTFVDFEGCKIVPVSQQGQPDTLKCKLYFKPVTVKGDGLYAIKVRGEETINKGRGKVTDLSVLVNTVNIYSRAKQFELEDIAKELLAEFLILPANNIKTVMRYNEDLDKEVPVRLPNNWNAFTEEIADQTVNPRYQTPYLAVTVDLLPIVAKLYGKKDPKEVKSLADRKIMPKDRYQYNVSIVKVLNAMVRSYILEIKRIDIKELNALANTIGYGTVGAGNILMTHRR